MDEKPSIFKRIHTDNYHWTDFILLTLLLAIVLMLLGQELGSIIVYLPFQSLISNNGFATITAMYLTFIGIWIVVLLYCLIVKKNRPIFGAIWKGAKGNTIPMLLIGIVIGFGTNAICAVGALLNKDIAIYFDSFDLLKLVILFLAIFVQSSAEELLCRGFIYQKLRKGYRHPAVAIIGNASLFAFLHIFNPGVGILPILNIFAVGIFYSLLVYYSDSIWCTMAIHAAWNFTQNIFFGLPNSGLVSPYSLFRLDAASAQNSFFYDVDFGIEGTMLSLIVQIACCVAVYLIYHKKNVQPYDPWN